MEIFYISPLLYEVYMAWLITEGLDRSGKTTVAEHFKKLGYEYVHLSAPDKKYTQPGYSGPTYMDEMLDLLMRCDGNNVIFDRSWYGEVSIWPYVYGRKPQLIEDDIEILHEFEERNDTRRILMMDTDKAAHWKRCVDNKEPLNLGQFKQADALYGKMAHKYNFEIRELKDFIEIMRKDQHVEKTATKDAQQDNSSLKQDTSIADRANDVAIVSNISLDGQTSVSSQDDDELVKLEQANAIKDILSKRILKQKGGAFDQLEDSMRSFLKTQLSYIFNKEEGKNKLTEDEVLVLKLMCQRIKAKEDKKQ